MCKLLKVLCLSLIGLSHNLYAQDISPTFGQIKRLACNYYPNDFPAQAKTDTDIDTYFKSIVDEGDAVIPQLIEKLTDTSLTSIKMPGDSSFLKKGDLAIILIDHIRLIPLAIVFKTDLDVCCVCGALPFKFLSYFNNNRALFQSSYKKYYFSLKHKKSRPPRRP